MKCEDCKHYVWSWEPPCALCVFTPKKGYCKRYVPKVENAVEQLRALDAVQACPSCSGVGHYLVGNFDEQCSECEGTGQA